MRCLFYSYCDEPKYLCCNFCSNKKCEKRCLDNHTKCRFYEKGDVDIDENKVNHIITKSKRSTCEVIASENQIEKKDVISTKSSKSKNQSSKSTSETKSNVMKSKSTAKSKTKKQNSNTKIGEKISLF